MMKEIELHLVDAAAPSGEIAIKDLAALATALQELTTRISRDPINTPGPGRTKQFMEELSQLASAPGPDIDGGIDLTDDEFQAFLQAARSSGGAFVNQVAATVVDTDVFSLI